MNRIKRILLFLILLISFLAAVFALTDLWPNNLFKEYKFLIVIAFISLGGLTRLIMKRKTKNR
jgi:hypothetical protein